MTLFVTVTNSEKAAFSTELQWCELPRICSLGVEF